MDSVRTILICAIMVYAWTFTVDSWKQVQQWKIQGTENVCLAGKPVKVAP